MHELLTGQPAPLSMRELAQWAAADKIKAYEMEKALKRK